MSRPRRLPSVAGMHHEPFLYDLVRAHERDLRNAADQHRLARSVRPDRPTSLDRLRAAGTLAWLIRGARRTAPVAAGDPSRTEPAADRGRVRTELTAARGASRTAPAAGHLSARTGCSRPRPGGIPDAAQPAECCC
jgi:hypothetical protein